MGLDPPQIVLYTSGLDHPSAAEKSWQRLGERMLHSCGDSSLFSPLDLSCFKSATGADL